MPLTKCPLCQPLSKNRLVSSEQDCQQAHGPDGQRQGPKLRSTPRAAAAHRAGMLQGQGSGPGCGGFSFPCGQFSLAASAGAGGAPRDMLWVRLG